VNPPFVGSLMGWTNGQAFSACSATEFTHWQQCMRGALALLSMTKGPSIWRPVDGLAQMNLFKATLSEACSDVSGARAARG